MAALIELEGITKNYQLEGLELKILKGISLKIDAGEFVSIIGPSGSGKSTLMHIMGLLDNASGGKLRIMGQDISALSDEEMAYMRADVIGFIFQQFNLLPKMNAEQNVSLPQIYLNRKNGNEISARSLLDEVGLSDRSGHRPSQMSGGQQQRVAIARALKNNPKIIFADEPTGNLETRQSHEIIELLRNLNREKGITVIIVTHDPEVAAKTDRQIKVRDGLIVEDITNIAANEAESSENNQKNAEKRQFDGISMPKRHFLTFKEAAESVKSSISSLMSRKLRSFLTMLGVIIGVFSLTVMVTAVQTIQREIMSIFNSFSNVQVTELVPNTSAMGQKGLRFKSSRITVADAEAFRSVEGVTGLSGGMSSYMQAIRGSKNNKVQVVGVQADYARITGNIPDEGRFFTKEEDLRQDKVCVLGYAIAKDFFEKDEDPIGQTIRIGSRNFYILGVQPEKNFMFDKNIIVPLNTMMHRINGSRYLERVQVEVADKNNMERVEKEIIALYNKRHSVPEGETSPVEFENFSDARKQTNRILLAFSALMVLIAGISLLVGGIGIMNIMLVSVSERTKEIGLRKAMGATRNAVLAQFLAESVLISVIGGAIGLAGSGFIAFVVSLFVKWKVYISLSTAIGAFIFCTVFGITFGFLPAWKASKMSPIEALRYE